MNSNKINDIFDNISKYKILFTYKDEKTLKNYVVYTDNSKKSDGSLNTFAAIYNPNNLNEPLKELESKKEWDALNTILYSIQTNLKYKKYNNLEKN